MQRPLITDYRDPVTYMRDMLRFRKMQEPSFRISRLCRGLQRCSPALVSNILAGKRRLTLDRIDDIAQLLALSPRERHFLREWIRGKRPISEPQQSEATQHRGRSSSSFLLNDWIYPYVKDAFRLATVRASQDSIYQELGTIASRTRIDKAIRFLEHHGYLARNAEGRLVESSPLHNTGDKQADRKIRRFHARALDIAKEGLELYGTTERLAQALVLPLDAASHAELRELIQDFSNKLKDFAAKHSKSDKRLYQLVLHLTPTGGHRETK